MIDHVDHIVLTTRDLDGCIRFYRDVLGMKLEKFAQGRLALRHGCLIAFSFSQFDESQRVIQLALQSSYALDLGGQAIALAHDPLRGG